MLSCRNNALTKAVEVVVMQEPLSTSSSSFGSLYTSLLPVDFHIFAARLVYPGFQELAF